MADAKPVLPLLNAESEKLVRDMLTKALDYSNLREERLNKLNAIDKAYARYLDAREQNDLTGMDKHGRVACNAADRAIVSPIVISQVQSMTAYFAEVFLSGYPIFPVVSNPMQKTAAESLEGIIQDHLVMSESIPELQMILHDAAKYNTAAYEVIWGKLTTYSPQRELVDVSSKNATLKVDNKHINKIKRINQRNFHYDANVPFSKVSTEGDYAGYTEIMSRVRLKDHLNYLSTEKTILNNEVVKLALESTFDSSDFREDPVISTHTASNTNDPDWDKFGGFTRHDKAKVPGNASGIYAKHVFFVRMIPSDYGIRATNANSVQVFRVEMINRATLISFTPYFGAFGAFGIGCCNAIEDGMDMQTQGYGEMAMPLQEMVTRLYNIRLQSAKRALQDRALYNPKMIRPADINSPMAAPKIAVSMDGMLEGSLSQAYSAIPFDGRGTENVLSDAREISEWQKELSGMNNATRGQFQKGNKSLGEFNAIMGNSENRMRLPALVLEFRMMQRIKNQIKLNLLQFGEDTEVISSRTGETLDVSIDQLQKVNLQFEVADGYTPKGKMANTEMLSQGMTMITQSPSLQQVYGSQMPAMFAHMMSLAGVRGFDQYTQTAVEEYKASFSLQAQIMQLQQQLAQSMQENAQPGGQQPPQQ